VRIVGRSSERKSYEVLFKLREENRETHSIQKVRFLLRTMPRIVHDHPMSLKPQYRLFIFTSKMVRGVGFEPLVRVAFCGRLFGLHSTNSLMLCLTIVVRFEGAYVGVSEWTKD